MWPYSRSVGQDIGPSMEPGVREGWGWPAAAQDTQAQASALSPAEEAAAKFVEAQRQADSFVQPQGGGTRPVPQLIPQGGGQSAPQGPLVQPVGYSTYAVVGLAAAGVVVLGVMMMSGSKPTKVQARKVQDRVQKRKSKRSRK